MANKLIVNVKLSPKVSEDLMDTLADHSSTLLFQRVLEMLRHRVRYEKNLPYEGGHSEGFEALKDIQYPDNGDVLTEELEYLVNDLVEEIVGEQQEGQSDEAYQALLEETSDLMGGCCLTLIEDILKINAITDFSGLIDFDFNKEYTMTWNSTPVELEGVPRVVHYTFVLTQ